MCKEILYFFLIFSPQPFKNIETSPSHVAQCLEYQPTKQRVKRSIPGYGHVPGLQARSPPHLGHVQESAKLCVSSLTSVFLSFSLSLSSLPSSFPPPKKKIIGKKNFGED